MVAKFYSPLGGTLNNNPISVRNEILFSETVHDFFVRTAHGRLEGHRHFGPLLPVFTSISERYK